MGVLYSLMVLDQEQWLVAVIRSAIFVFLFIFLGLATLFLTQRRIKDWHAKQKFSLDEKALFNMQLERECWFNN